MEVVPQLISEEAGSLRIYSDSPAEPVRLLRFPGYDGQIAIPTCSLLGLESIVYEFMPHVLETLSALPDSSLFRFVVMTPHGGKGTESSLLNASNSLPHDHLYIKLPHDGVSLRADIFDAWATVLEESSAINSYLFGLACQLQRTLGEESPTFSNTALLFRYLTVSLLAEEPLEVELSKRPLLSLLVLEAIGNIIKRKAESSISLSQGNADILAKLDRLKAEELLSVGERLLHIANESSDQLLQASAAKLLLHIGRVEQIERIREVSELDLQGEPVGEKVLQKIKYIGSLELLNLTDTIFPSEALRHLAYLPVLRILRLASTRTHNNAIVHLSSSPSLEEIDCSDTAISDEGARHFLSFKSLKTVFLAGTTVSDKMIELLQESKLNVISE